MGSFLFKRLLVLIPTFLGVTIVAFSLIRMVPGDPVMILMGERGSSPELYQSMREKLGLNEPLPVQYFKYLKRALQLDLGDSIVSKRPVIEEFFSRFPATFELGIIGLFFAVVIGIPLGVIAAIKRNSVFDYSLMGASLIGFSMPIFWWGLVLILVFSVQLGLTPVSGRIGFEYDIHPVTGFLLIDTLWTGAGWGAFFDALKHMILPATALGTIPLAVVARMTRSSMLEVLGEDYMRTAKAKGLKFGRIVFIHGLRNALIPVITVIGFMFGTIVTGAILTETIFSWPGIGKWLVASVTSRDYPVIQGGILIIAAIIVFVNMAVDVIYGLVNPRMRDQK